MKIVRNFVFASAIVFMSSFPFVIHAFAITKFGGTVTDVKTCTCLYDPALIVTVKDISTKQSIRLKYSLFYSTLRANYMLRPGAKVLGGASMQGNPTCLQQATYTCTTDSSGKADAIIDILRGVGTSKVGGGFGF